MSAPKLTPAAEALLARIEAREAKARTKAETPEAEEKQEGKTPSSDFTLGPNPLDFLK